MPPVGSKSKGKGRDGRSRNTTPMSTGSGEHAQPSTSAAPSQTSAMNYDDLLERFCRSSSPPPSTTLKKIAESLKSFSDLAKNRSDTCDKGMREFSKRKKELTEITREQEIAAREAEEDRKERQKKTKLKKERDEDRPLAVGAHAVARQDGVEQTDSASVDNEETASQAEGKPPAAAPASPSPSSSSLSSHQPRPAPAVPQYQTFGPDPSTFDDPTVYHLRDLEDDMQEEEKNEILGVSYYPHDDLHDLTPGTPPDRDFSNAKPPNQVSATQFANYLEPYVRPLTEEDLAFLKERGDRISPFMIPRRGLRGYKEIWAEEDGGGLGNNAQNSSDHAVNNQPNGSIDQMNDDIAETSEVSTGPMLARLLAILRPERRAPVSEANAIAQINGDPSTNNATGGEFDSSMHHANEEQQARNIPPSTYFPESIQYGWKTQGPKMDYSQVEDRIKSELRHIGFLSDEADPDYEGHHDDEVAARLRYLQQELHHIGILNGARKARVLELVEERMAQQEYSTIADDLDTQLNQAYLKRHRNIGKGKNKLKRPGGSAGGGNSASSGVNLSKPGVGEPIRSLMERRSQWNNLIGPVVDFGKTTIPGSTIFDEDNLNRLIAREKESWSEAQDQS